MEILWLWGNAIFLSFVPLAPPSHCRDGHDEIQTKPGLVLFIKKFQSQRHEGYLEQPQHGCARSCPVLVTFQTPSGRPCGGNLIQQGFREDQNLGFREEPKCWKVAAPAWTCVTPEPGTSPPPAGLFYKSDWAELVIFLIFFFLLMPFLVTMELRAAHPRQAPRNMITGKTLQGLFGEDNSSHPKCQFKVSSDRRSLNLKWVGKSGRRLVVKLGSSPAWHPHSSQAEY